MIGDDIDRLAMETQAMLAAGAEPSIEGDVSEATTMGPFAAVSSALFGSVSAVKPEARVKAALMHRIAAEAGQIDVQHSRDDVWKPSGELGVSMRRLGPEWARQPRFLIRIPANVTWQEMADQFVADCLLLEGDARLWAIDLVDGDFATPAFARVLGSVATRGGCLLLVSMKSN